MPSYNEALNLPKVIQSIFPYGKVYVINDNSNDNTLDIIKNYDVKIINNKKKLGYDRSLAKGFNEIKNSIFDYVVTLDADGEHSSFDILKIINEIKKNNFDIILGYRDKKRRLSERIMAYIFYLKFNVNDCLCGLKAFRKDIIDFDNINNYDSINTELLFFTLKTKKIKLNQIPINVALRKGTTSFGGFLNIKGNLKIIKSLIVGFYKFIL